MKTCNRREPPPPSRWGRSSTGTPFRVSLCSRRDHLGRKLYRLVFAEGVKGSRHWTLADLQAAGVRWLKRRPRELPAA